MLLREKIRRVLREFYGDFQTNLELEYENTITENLLSGSLKNKKEWVTYNQVILEIKHNLKNSLKVKQLQYELTENTDPNMACINVLDGFKFKTVEMERLYYKIKGF